MDEVRCHICQALRKFGERRSGLCVRLRNLAPFRATGGEVGSLSYLNAKQNKRFVTSTGKFIRKFFGDGRTDHWIQKIQAELTNSIWDGFDNVKELQGEKLREFYLESVSHIHSCMAYEDTQPYLNIYVDNPDVVSLLTVRIKENCARAILWTIKGKRYCDRIYWGSDTCHSALKGYCEANNIYKREEMRCLEVEMKIRNGESSYWPYMDTMMYATILSKDKCRLSTENGDYNLDTTDGIIGDNITCECCERTGHEDEMVSTYDGMVCEYCYEEYYDTCNSCGEIFHRDVMASTSSGGSVCDNCADNYYHICRNCDGLVPTDVCTEINGYFYCEDCRDELFVECSDCGEWTDKDYIKDDMCPECYEEAQDIEEEEEEDETA